MAKNVSMNTGVPVSILGEDYNLSLTMLGMDYLDEQYGVAGAAMQSFVEMGKKFKEGSVDKESRDVLCNWVRASLIHNQFDRNGNKVREIPTVFQIHASLSVGELLGMAKLVLASYQVSFPVPKEGDEIDPQ
jgi:hypothetical protein